MANETVDERLVADALAGREAAVVRLVERLTPVIQARVARVLLAGGAGPGVRSRVEDLTQETFLTLFADGGRVLAGWSPERGLSLDNYAGLVARRRALSILRTGKGDPWREDPTLNDELDGLDDRPPPPGPEAETVSRQQLSHLLCRLRETLSPLGWHLFELLYLRQQTVEETRLATGMSADAVYAWRSRLRRLARRLAGEAVSEP